MSFRGDDNNHAVLACGHKDQTSIQHVQLSCTSILSDKEIGIQRLTQFMIFFFQSSPEDIFNDFLEKGGSIDVREKQ